MSGKPILSLAFLAFAILFANSRVCAEPIDPRPRRNAEEIGAALEYWRLRHKVPGIAVAIFDADKQQTWLKGRRDDSEPVTEDTVFQAGQVANLLTAMALHTLADEGTLSLDARVRDLVPEVDLQNPWAEGADGAEQAVLVRQLLSHQAGVSPLHFRDLFIVETGAGQASGEARPLLAGLNRSFRALRLDYQPGSRQVYSQAAYGLAAYLVDRGSELGYARAIDTLLPGMDLRPGTQSPRARNDLSLPEDMHPVLGGSVNVELDIGTFAQLGQLMLRKGELAGERLLQEDVVTAMESPVLDYIPAYTAGGLRQEAFHGRKLWLVAGAYPGAVARLAYWRDAEGQRSDNDEDSIGQGYAILINGEPSAAALGELENFLRGQVRNRAGYATEGRLPEARPALPQPASTRFPAFWRKAKTNPIEAYLGDWLDVATAEVTGTAVHWQPLLAESSVWRLHGGGLLREAGSWWPGRVLRNSSLQSADAQWTAIPGWQYFGGLAAGAFVALAWMATLVHGFAWIAASVRGQVHGYHEWLPRLMPLLAHLCLLAFLLLLARLEVPGIGQPGALTYSLLIVSVLLPLLALASLPAALAGIYWKLEWRTSLLNLAGSVAALVAAAWLVASGLFGFQSWNY